MKLDLRIALALTLLGGACSPGTQSQEKKLRPGEPDPNKHLEGTTGVLKDYRLPAGSKNKPQRPDFRSNAATDKKNQKESPTQ
jgi:hypothetical protein